MNIKLIAGIILVIPMAVTVVIGLALLMVAALNGDDDAKSAFTIMAITGAFMAGLMMILGVI